MPPKNPTRMGLLATAATLAILAAGAASAGVYGPGPLSVTGTASTCTVTPGSPTVVVLTGFSGSINGSPVSALTVTITLVSGSITCSPSGGVYFVRCPHGAVGTAVTVP